MDIDIEGIKNRYKRLPQYVRDAIASFDVASVVQEIVKEHRLHIDQGGELADEIDSVLIGETEREIFLPNIKKRLNISDETAKEIVKEVNDNILIPIKKQMQQRKNGEEPEEAPQKESQQKQVSPSENIDVEALEKIEKDKYREPIENEDITLDTNSIPENGVGSPTNQKKESLTEEPFDRASVLKEIEDPEETPPEQPPQEQRGVPEPAEKTETSNQPKETPRPSMVRDLISEARKQQTHQAEKYLARERVNKTSDTQPAENVAESKSRPDANLPKAEQSKEKGEMTPPTKSGETRKQEIKNDPYREPIE